MKKYLFPRYAKKHEINIKKDVFDINLYPHILEVIFVVSPTMALEDYKGLIQDLIKQKASYIFFYQDELEAWENYTDREDTEVACMTCSSQGLKDTLFIDERSREKRDILIFYEDKNSLEEFKRK